MLPFGYYMRYRVKQDKHPVIRRRNVKHTNWDTYEDQLNVKVGL